MKVCRHSGQVIGNDDGFNPVKILGDLHAKSVRKIRDQNVCPSCREGTGMFYRLRYRTGRQEKMEAPEHTRRFGEWPLRSK